MRVLVCGGVKYDRLSTVMATLSQLHYNIGISLIIHNCAPGAATFAGLWAASWSLPESHYPEHDGEGFFIWNERIVQLSRPQMVVHFPGQTSTRNMIMLAKRANILVYEGDKE